VQLPQWFESVEVSTHVEPQTVRPGEQAALQFPPMQISVGWQGESQPPQFCSSVFGSMHEPEQSSFGAEQTPPSMGSPESEDDASTSPESRLGGPRGPSPPPTRWHEASASPNARATAPPRPRRIGDRGTAKRRARALANETGRNRSGAAKKEKSNLCTTTSVTTTTRADPVLPLVVKSDGFDAMRRTRSSQIDSSIRAIETRAPYAPS